MKIFRQKLITKKMFETAVKIFAASFCLTMVTGCQRPIVVNNFVIVTPVYTAPKHYPVKTHKLTRMRQIKVTPGFTGASGILPGACLNKNATNEPPSGETCKIACYSHKKEESLYQVASDAKNPIYVHGFTYVLGKRNTGINHYCVPRTYEHSDISALQEFKNLCNLTVPSCADTCWAGGDTAV